MRTAYKCRAYPNLEQASVLIRTFGCIRGVWNRTLAWRHARYYGEQARTNFTQASAYLTAMPDPVQLPATGAVIGVDLGITNFAVASDGEKFPNWGKLARRERNLARYQRRMARCQKGSANRGKAKAKVARAHRKVRASRQDFLHRTAARLLRDHDVIVIEDLAVKNMVRNRSLAKVISDCQLRYPPRERYRPMPTRARRTWLQPRSAARPCRPSAAD